MNVTDRKNICKHFSLHLTDTTNLNFTACLALVGLVVPVELVVGIRAVTAHSQDFFISFISNFSSFTYLIANCHRRSLTEQTEMLRWVLFALLLGVCASVGAEKKKQAKTPSIARGG